MNTPNFRILIVDDRHENLFVLKALLEPEGLQIDEALDGETALKKAMKTDYALILLDIQMPGMDGFEVASQLKSITKTREIPIIFLTALQRDEKYLTRSFEVGAVDYLTKPIDETLLKLKVKSFLLLFQQKQELNKLNLQLERLVEERTGQLIRESEQNKRIIQSIQQVFYVQSYDSCEGKIVLKFVSPQIEKLVGVKAEEFIKDPDLFPRLVQPDNQEPFQVSGNSEESSNSLLKKVYRIKNQISGEYFWVENRMTPVYKNGVLSEIYGAILDITDRKKSEHLLRIQKRVFASADEGFIITDPNLKGNPIIFVNRCVTETTGYSEAELIGRSFNKFIEQLSGKGSDNGISGKLSAGGKVTAEVLFYGKQEKSFWADFKFSPILDSAKKLQNYICIIRDVTGKKRDNILREIIYNISKAAVSVSSVTECCRVIWNELKKYLVSDSFYITQYDYGLNLLEFPFMVQNGRETESYSSPRKLGNGLSEYIIKEKKGLLLCREDLKKFMEEKGIQFYGKPAVCWMGAPVISNNEVIGSIGLHSYSDVQVFSEVDFELITYVGRQLGSFIERKKKEEELQKTTENLQNIVDNIEEVVYSVEINLEDRLKSEILFISEKAEELLGVKSQDLMSNPEMFIKSIYPGDLENFLFMKSKVYEGEPGIVRSYRYFNKEKSQWLWLEHTANPVYENGVVKRVYGAIRDVTSKAEAERAIRESEARLERAQEIAKTGSWEWDVHSDAVGGSKQFFRIFGLSEKSGDKFVQDFFKFIHEDDRIHEWDFRKSEIVAAGSFIMEFRIFDVSGNLKWISITGERKKDSKDGNKFFGTIQDITDLKITEEALKESEEQFRSLAENAPNLILKLDLQGHILYINHNFDNMSRDELIGKKYSELLEESAREMFSMQLSEVASTGNPASLEYQCQGRGGELIWFSSVIGATVKNGRVDSFVVINIDISKRKQDEANLMDTAAKLKRVNSELQNFAFITAHDLRAPVVNLIGLSKIINKDALGTEKNKEILEKIKSSAKKIDSTLHDLMEIVTLKNQINEKSELVDFQSLFEEVREEIDGFIEGSSAEIKAEFKEADCIRSIRALAKSVFHNLLVNAIKYMKPGVKPVIRISTIKTGPFICVTFSDNGLGMDEKTIKEKLFLPFKRFHPGIDGKGLGLYLVKSQVEALGGKIEVESLVDVGTTFRVYLKDFDE